MSDVFSTDPPAIDASRRFTPDLAAWSREQARLLRERSAQEIDWDGAATALDVIGDLAHAIWVGNRSTAELLND